MTGNPGIIASRACATIASSLTIAALCMASLSACGTMSPATDGPTHAESKIDQHFNIALGQQLAPSLEAYIDQTIEDVRNDREIRPYDPTGEATARKLAILERTKARGFMSAADNELIWSNYKTCMLDRGYKEIIILTQINGVRNEAGHMLGTSQQEGKYRRDALVCGILNIGMIDSIYRVQQGNQGLAKNPYEGSLDCLHKSNAVPKEYSLDDLKHDLFRDSVSVKPRIDYNNNMAAAACLIANNIVVGQPSMPMERLW